LALREQTPFSVAFLDIDRFKSYNDQFGHASGDQVLTLIAHRVQSVARKTDMVARYGGEEFVVLMPRTTPDQAKRVVERMLSAVRDTPCQIRGGPSVQITFSA